MAAQPGSHHVPKFGNWNSDNIPYTAYFNQARQDRSSGMKIMNPNDPEENPEAFKFGIEGVKREDISHSSQASVSSESSVSEEKHHAEELKQQGFHQRKMSSDHQKSWSHKSVVSESSSERSNSDSISRSNKSTKKKSGSESHKSASVPKFGAWNENPASGDGFTLIFNKVKEERHIGASKFQPVHVQQSNDNTITQKKTTESKRKCCLLF